MTLTRLCVCLLAGAAPATALDVLPCDPHSSHRAEILHRLLRQTVTALATTRIDRTLLEEL
jgi:hypothetical protein